ncbi:hypothetical protein VSS74_25105 [Conexibacter stalactiti]|uniref:Uncharacterized protein n=1 Tax=Conexibacter stalactiti TaxID=1940611 RepID=A0ABU4HWW1_9ACTN|nr:hypothetical protein [Conexibacter stalactiti]MDW5597654.1 hypothetical protein [Conexibacter stalactiti]MEC5038296.1 hypothetical protein [Conexibacter stalactiti]
MARLRLEADLIFDDGDPAAQQTYDALVALAPALRTIPGARGVTPSRVALHLCHHDEEDGGACEPLSAWEVG